MISFAQTYYTVDVDQGEGSFLYKSFKLEDFKDYRPVYVSSLAYGRLGFITLESTSSLEEIKAGVDAILDTPSLAIAANASASVTAVQNCSNLNITVIGSDTVVTDLKAFSEFLENGGFSATSTGQIVSYKLRFVDDNSVANTIYNGEYTIRKTTQVKGNLKVTVIADGIHIGFPDSSKQADISGTLNITPTGGSAKTLWYKDRTARGVYPDSTNSFYNSSTFYPLDSDPYSWNSADTSSISYFTSFYSDTFDLGVENYIYELDGSGSGSVGGQYKPLSTQPSFSYQDAMDATGNYLTLKCPANGNSANSDNYITFRVKVTLEPVYNE